MSTLNVNCNRNRTQTHKQTTWDTHIHTYCVQKRNKIHDENHTNNNLLQHVTHRRYTYIEETITKIHFVAFPLVSMICDYSPQKRIVKPLPVLKVREKIPNVGFKKLQSKNRFLVYLTDSQNEPLLFSSAFRLTAFRLTSFRHMQLFFVFVD